VNQLDQPVDCILTVSFLRPEPPRINNEDAASGYSPAG
jgi:hypothetical protein